MNVEYFFKKLSSGAKFTANRKETLIPKVSDASNEKILNHLNEKSKGKEKNLEQIAHLKNETLKKCRKQHRIFVWGSDVPDPVSSLNDLESRYNLNKIIVENSRSIGYNTLTPIQMQAIPAMLEGRELLACAPTGSGKTAAYLIPILHCLKEHKKIGIRAVIVAPTRELAKQIERECQKIGDGSGITSFIIKKANINKPLPKFKDILVTTPNRLVFMINQSPPLISLKKVRWLVIDESDKLFESGKQGFREQLAVIYKACDGPQLRRALFSATFACEVEQWCKLNMDNVMTVSIGARNSAVDIIKQNLLFVGTESGKILAFRDLMKKGIKPPVLVFLQSKERAKELFRELIYDGINVDVIHAERTQNQRDNVVKSFRAGKIWVLICTELMSRGIDFRGVNLVVNYDFPPSSISYIHRIGRTGRAGRPGEAITFFTEDDVPNLKIVAQIMMDSGCEIPEYIKNLKAPSRKDRKALTIRAPKRKSISTIPKDELKKIKLHRQITKKGKEIKS